MTRTVLHHPAQDSRVIDCELYRDKVSERLNVAKFFQVSMDAVPNPAAHSATRVRRAMNGNKT